MSSVAQDQIGNEYYSDVKQPYQGKLLSADSHVCEPANLWQERMDKKWRDVAPRVESLEDGDYYIVKDLHPRPVAFEGAMADIKAKGIEITAFRGYRYANNRPGTSDPVERMKDQDIDGVSGEVIYPGIGLIVNFAPDGDYQLAACQAYNDWISEYCGAYPKRLKGAGMLPVHATLDQIVTEAKRVAKLGLSGVVLPSISDKRPYNQPEWDKLWAVCQDNNLLVNLHLGGRETYGRVHGPGTGGILLCLAKTEMHEALNHIIWSGAPIRFPKVKWVLVEGGIGWIASQITLMDHWWNDHKGWLEPRLPEPPSFYFKRQFYGTFEDDRAGVLTREITGVENIMWASDYPHTEGVWPFSRYQVARDFEGIPAVDTKKIVCDNVAKLYNFD